MNWGEFVDRYTDIALGGLIGTAAKYGLSLSEGRRITWRWIVGDLLLIAFVLLAARLMADWMHLERDGAAMCGALCALGSYKLVQMIRTRFLKKFDDTLAQMAAQARGDIRQELQLEASKPQALQVLRGSDDATPIYQKPEGPAAP